jgi:hypothetical protein
MRDRWRSVQRDDPDEETYEPDEVDGFETGPFDDPTAVALAEEEHGDSSEEENPNHGTVEQHFNRQWRFKNDRVEVTTRDMLNDQSWYLSQHVFLTASTTDSHGTSLLVKYTWTEDEKLAYATSGMLPEPGLDMGVVAIGFGRRLYKYWTGERQFLKSSVRKYNCSKIRTLYILSDLSSGSNSLDKMTLHCIEPTLEPCTQYEGKHHYM